MSIQSFFLTLMSSFTFLPPLSELNIIAITLSKLNFNDDRTKNAHLKPISITCPPNDPRAIRFLLQTLISSICYTLYCYFTSIFFPSVITTRAEKWNNLITIMYRIPTSVCTPALRLLRISLPCYCNREREMKFAATVMVSWHQMSPLMRYNGSTLKWNFPALFSLCESDRPLWGEERSSNHWMA
jgi:hypothetical protein